MKTKILLADDEDDLEDLFQQLFHNQIQSQTYEFFFARNGIEALILLEQQPDVDVLITDISMPGMDGLTLLAKVSAINPILHVIILTAYGDIDNIRMAMNRGAFDFLTKPINFQDLKATLEKTIRAANQHRERLALKAMDGMKSRFFANITHELRTPLSLIIILIDKLSAELHLPLLYQQPLSAIQRNVHQLLRLINQLLDVDKLEAGQMELNDEVGDLPGFVSQIIEQFQPSAAIKQLTLSYQADMLPGNYAFEARAWEKILSNLLSNAIKFTYAGHISVDLAQTPTTVQITVSDTGIGIPADELPHIFDRFYQVGNHRSRAYEGVGIGLALVHELTSKLGGTIRVRSQTPSLPGSFSTVFEVELPAQRVGEAAVNQASMNPSLKVEVPYVPNLTPITPELTSSSQLPLVLIVDDNDELRNLIAMELALLYRICTASDGHQGLLIAKENLPDVIVSDLKMPLMDGWELVKQIRSDPATNHIAIILLTAHAQESSRLKGLTYGADDYLTKPFHLNELTLRLRNLLTRQANLRAHYHQQLLAESGPMAESVTDSFVRQLHEFIEAHLDDATIGVDDLAGAVSMSRRTFHRKLTVLTNLPPSELLRRYRLQRARQLLKTGLSISETAYRVGFESPAYFANVFKQTFDQTPSEFVKDAKQ